MSRLLLATAVLLLPLSVFAQFPAWQDIPPLLDLNTLPNNSLYFRWRQKYHIVPPGGHINDPCGPVYDPRTDTYHIFYQSFPQHVQGGNTSWAHAVSNDDMVTWTDVGGWQNRSYLALSPSPYYSYDWIGDFSGSVVPVDLHGKSDGPNMTMFFTGASRWPDYWEAPYAKHTEMQSIATSSDGGVTWQKYSGNPIISEPPGGWNVTGFRDPIVGPDPRLDIILGYDEPHYYMLIGSGIRGDNPREKLTPGAGPRIPLYSALATDLTNWTFLGALFEPPQNYSFGGDGRKTGSWAYNFELAGFYALVEEKQNGGDGFTVHWALTVGSEGFEGGFHPDRHTSLYTLGQAYKRPENQSIEYRVDASAPLDWGNLYAVISFQDTKKKRRVLWGWSDEQMNLYGAKAMGFQGAFALPREAFILVTHNVTIPPEGVSQGQDVWVPTPDPLVYTVKTLGTRPLPDVVASIQGEGQRFRPKRVKGLYKLTECTCDSFHLRATISDFAEDGSVGVIFRASPDGQEYTLFTYYASNNSVVFDRTHSSLIDKFSKATYIGYHRPYTFANGDVQPLNIDLYVDGGLVEFFINDRFALTGRVYPSKADALGLGFFSDGGYATFEGIRFWNNMTNVWPRRPLNASSPLVYDAYYQNHVTFENPYVAVGTELYPGW